MKLAEKTFIVTKISTQTLTQEMRLQHMVQTNSFANEPQEG